jgi:alginate O-acetyltransferase complex protein AlgI
MPLTKPPQAKSVNPCAVKDWPALQHRHPVLTKGTYPCDTHASADIRPMIFNSYVYLLLFLPISLLGYFLLKRVPLRVAFAWLVLVSLVFYGWWNPDETGEAKWTPFYVVLILGSCIGNYLFGRFIADHKQTRLGKGVLTVGVVANLLLLGYYKYAGFLVGLYQDFTGAPHQIPHIVLPLAISFFTFLQVAYLVDAYRGETKEVNFTDYLLFVTFFPHLIAGPLVHHKEMLPQFTKGTCRHRLWASLSVGLTYLILGLFKKVVIADNAAVVANAIFGLAASESRQLTFLEAWAGALTYAIRLYFDFSGYSDMAIGSARLFGIRFPLNFHSPYKAVSIIDFWRRWHMTLSRFLRDYLYFPLGGNRKGKTRRYVNLLLTMILGGIWHGAGFAFLLWGFLHGLFLCINHGWIAFRKKHNIKPLAKPVAIGITFLLVVLAWVPFYAGSFEHGPNGSTQKAITVTKNMYAAMFGLNGFEAWPDRSAYVAKASHAGRAVLWLAVCWFLPNTQQFLRRYSPALDVGSFDENRMGPRRWWQWRPTIPWFVFTFVLLIIILTQFDKVSEFIYFQF